MLKDSVATAAVNVVAESWSVITTTLFGSAPLSPEVLDVDVVAQSVTWSPFTTPVRLRRPTVVTFGYGPSGPVRPLSTTPMRPWVST